MKFSKLSIAVVLVSGMALLVACGGDSKPTGSQNTPSGTSGTDNPIASILSATECVQVSQALAIAVSGGFGSGTIDVDDAVASLQRVADSAASEVKTDLALLAAELRRFYEALKTAGADFNNPNTFQNPQTLQALGAAASAFQTSGAQAASERIQTYFRSICPS